MTSAIFLLSLVVVAVCAINETEQLFEKQAVEGATQDNFFSNKIVVDANDFDMDLLKDIKDDSDQHHDYYSYWLADRWPFGANVCGGYGHCCSLKTGEMIDYFKSIYPIFNEDCSGTPCVELGTSDVCVSQPLDFDSFVGGDGYLIPGLYQNLGTMLYVSPVSDVEAAKRSTKRGVEAAKYVAMKLTNQNHTFAFTYFFDSGDELVAMDIDTLVTSSVGYQIIKMRYEYYEGDACGSAPCFSADSCGDETDYRLPCCEYLCCPSGAEGCCRFPDMIITQLGSHTNSDNKDTFCSNPDVGELDDWEDLGDCIENFFLTYAGISGLGYGFGLSKTKAVCVYAFHPFEKSFIVTPAGIKPVSYNECAVCTSGNG